LEQGLGNFQGRTRLSTRSEGIDVVQVKLSDKFGFVSEEILPPDVI
jgi:hypothetical protein